MPYLIKAEDTVHDVEMEFDEERHAKDIEKTRLRAFFRAEVAAREQTFLKAMDDGARFREFENQVVLLWGMFPNAKKKWIKELRNKWDHSEPFPVALSDEENN